MPTDLILTNINYTDSSLTNGKEYSLGGDYACNYPLDATVAFVINGTLGSIYITASTGDFTDLLGCDIQNNNVPTKKWITGDTGQILEIDYVISATRAALKKPSSYSIVGGNFAVVDYWKSPQVAETTICNSDGLGAAGVIINTKIGPLALNFGANQSFALGSDPITVDLGATGTAEIMIISYQ